MKSPQSPQDFLKALAAGELNAEQVEHLLAESPELRDVAGDLEALEERLDQLGAEAHIDEAITAVEPADLESSKQFFGVRFEQARRSQRRSRLMLMAAAFVAVLGLGWILADTDPSEPEQDRFLGANTGSAELLELRFSEPLELDLEFAEFDRMQLEFFGMDGAALAVPPLILESWPWVPEASDLEALPAEGRLRVTRERSGSSTFRFVGEYDYARADG